MKKLFLLLLLASALQAVESGAQISLQKVALREGERIASIEVIASGGRFSDLRIPSDWSFEVGAPVSGVSTLRGSAAHGVGMPFTTAEFQRFVRVVYAERSALSVKVRLGLYLHDPKKGESERVLELTPESVVLETPNQTPDPTR
jgi:hypothetical protein